MKNRLLTSLTATVAGCTVVMASGFAWSTPSGASYPPIPAGPISFGISLPLSGSTAAYGTEAEASYKVVEQEFDSRYPNGIDGHPVKFDIQNDQGVVTGAVQAAPADGLQQGRRRAGHHLQPRRCAPAAPRPQRGQRADLLVRQPRRVETTAKDPYYFGMCASTPDLGLVAGQWLSTHPQLDKIGILTDGVASDTQFAEAVTAGVKKYDAHAKVVATQTIAPGSVEVSSPIAALKAAGSNLVVVAIGYGYGPIWQGIQTAGWSPEILTSAGAWYDGFTAAWGPWPPRPSFPTWTA